MIIYKSFLSVLYSKVIFSKDTLKLVTGGGDIFLCALFAVDH